MFQSPTTVELCIVAPSTLTRDEYSSDPWLELGGCVRQAPGVVGTRLIVSIAKVTQGVNYSRRASPKDCVGPSTTHLIIQPRPIGLQVTLRLYIKFKSSGQPFTLMPPLVD
jgi:hypothetical protein